MFRESSPQSPLWQPVIAFPGILPLDDWSYIFKNKIYPLIDENDFKHLYHDTIGAPNKPIKLQVSLLLFMAIEKLNWREAEFQFARRIDWMNATYTPFGEADIDHTTLFKFFQKLENDDAAYKIFQKLTANFIVECSVSMSKQRVDSFFMDGWLERLSRYGLLKETNRSFLQNLRKQKPGLYEEIKKELSRDYLYKSFDLTEKDKAIASRKIIEMANDMHHIKSAFENHKQIKNYKTFEILSKVFEQQCVVKTIKDEKGKDRQNIEIREKPKGTHIISTPHNPDAQYTKKRKQTVVGHKGFVTETCDPENEVQFITDVNLEKAGHSDSVEISLIEQRLEDNNLKPKKLYGDAGFVNGKSILESKEKDIDLEGPSSGRSQSFEEYNKEDRPFDIADFGVEVEEDTKEIKIISCPNKQSALEQSRSKKTGKIIVHFDVERCKECEQKARCPVKIGVRVATLTVNEEQYAGAVRHQEYMGNSDYRRECGIRAGAEGLVNEIANGHGARKARHRSKEGPKLQLVLAALGCNIKRYIRYVKKCGLNSEKARRYGLCLLENSFFTLKKCLKRIFYQNICNFPNFSGSHI